MSVAENPQAHSLQAIDEDRAVVITWEPSEPRGDYRAALKTARAAFDRLVAEAERYVESQPEDERWLCFAEHFRDNRPSSPLAFLAGLASREARDQVASRGGKRSVADRHLRIIANKLEEVLGLVFVWRL